MNKLLAVSALLLVLAFASLVKTNSAVASNCEVHSVKAFKGYSDSLRPDIEQILVKKGYAIIQDGYLYENYDVPEDQLRVRKELMKDQNLIGAFSTGLNDKDSTMCVKYMDGTVTCAFNFHLYRFDQNKGFVDIAKVEAAVEKKPWFLGSEKKITDGFVAEVLEAAENNIPNCK